MSGHVLIDITNGRALAKHASYRALAALHYVQFANVDAMVLPLNGTDAPFAALGPTTVADVLYNLTGQAVDDGLEHVDRVRQLRQLLEADTWLVIPLTAEQLDSQAFALHPSEARPAAVNLVGGPPQLLPAWTAEPQHNRRRDDSTFWVMFAAGEPSGRSPAKELPVADAPRTVPRLPQRAAANTNKKEDQTMATSKAVKKAATKAAKKEAPKAPAKKTAAKPATKPVTKPAKVKSDAQVDERNGIKRPKAGGKTEKVWVACDKLNDKKGSAPAFSEVNEYIDKHFADLAIPAATRRSNYACWRKYNGITGRVTA